MVRTGSGGLGVRVLQERDGHVAGIDHFQNGISDASETKF